MKLDVEVINLFKEWQTVTGKYLDIDIGKIRFNYKPLKDIHDASKVKSVKPASDKKFIEISDIDESTKQYDLSKKVKPNLPNSAKQAPKGTILISRVRPVLGSYTIVKDDQESFTSGDLNPVVLKPDINVEYAFESICSSCFKKFLIDNQDTGGQKPTITKKLYNYEILIPDSQESLAIQHSIVEFINFHKAKFNTYRQLINKLKSQVRSFDAAFIPAIFSENKDQFIHEHFNKWAKKNSLKVTSDRILLEKAHPFVDERFFSTQTPVLGLSQKDLISNQGGYPVFSGKKENLCFCDYGTSKLINASDSDIKISFATDGDSSAGTNFVIHKSPFYVNATRMVLSFNDGFSPLYFYYALLNMKSEYGFDYVKKANMTNLVDIEIFVPSGTNSKAIQDSIVQFIDNWIQWKMEFTLKVDKLLSNLDQAEEALIAKIFTGVSE